MVDNHFLFPLSPNTRIAIVAKTLKVANELFEKMNVFDRKFFIKDTLHHKVLYNNVKFVLAGSKNAACNTKGCTISLLIINDDVPQKDIDTLAVCIMPVIWSCSGTVLRYNNEKGFYKYEHKSPDEVR